MTCKDCIHYNICSLWTTSDLDEDEAYKYCFKHFKSTADVVEVVRCKDCKYYKAYEPPIEDFNGFCTANENEYDMEFYCQYGERREENEG